VEPDNYEVRVLGQGFSDPWDSLRRVFLLRLSLVAMKRDSTGRAKSMRLGAQWSSIGGLSQFRTWMSTDDAWAWIRLGGRSLPAALSFRQAGRIFSSTWIWELGCLGGGSGHVGTRGASSALGISPPVWQSFIGESSSMSCGALQQ
jgi:hypothetical protein